MQKDLPKIDLTDFLKKETKPRMTNHHVPPQNPDRKPKIIRKEERHHKAYHLLFGSPPSLEACVEILEKNWWPDG